MIIVKLMGGMGNQMFQYAAGRRLAERHRTVLKLDLGFLLDRTPKENFVYRDYELDVFNIQAPIAAQHEINSLIDSPLKFVPFIRRIINNKRYLKEGRYHFDKRILNANDNVYMDGYWQSEKCFAGIEAVIRQEFTIKTPQTGKDKELAERMASCESVSLHIRRGDYVSNSNTNRMHGTCKLEYYYRSVEVLTQAVKRPHFFIFSDDPDWASNNLSLPYPTILVTHNRIDKNYEDLRLMSQCKHHIIANSTFSWWGAWLNPNKEKIVIAPKKWFRDVTRNTNDLIPARWLRM